MKQLVFIVSFILLPFVALLSNPIMVLSEKECIDFCEQAQKKLVYVDGILDILDDNFFLVSHDSHTYAVPLDDARAVLQELPPETLHSYENYISELQNGHEVPTRKKFKNKTFCSALVKEKLTANNLRICNNAKLDNVTINGTLYTCSKNFCTLISTFSSTIFAGTSADIPLTLVLRDATGSFAATNITVTGVLQFQSNNDNNVTLAAAPNSTSYNLNLPTAPSGTVKVLGNDGAGNLEWITAITSGIELGLLETATSADIPLTLVLRDATGSFAATNITVTGAVQFQSNNGNSVTLAAAPNSAGYNLKLPTAQGGTLQVLGNDGAGNLEWITTLTNSTQLNLLYTATSADIPNTLVLRDTTGSFAATNITVTGCIILTDQLSNTAATICASTNALMVSPVAPRALQTTVNGNVRGLSAVDLQMNRALATQVASGNYSVITGGQNNTASASNSVVLGGFYNNISNTFSGIVSGSGNTVSSNFAFIGGGQANVASANDAIIGGGFNNIATSQEAAILSGYYNNTTGSSAPACIVAGFGNTITHDPHNFIGAGMYNTMAGSFGSILTGSGNTVGDNFGPLKSGQSNSGLGSFSALTTGMFNSIAGAPLYSGMLTGSSNSLVSGSSFLGCGQNNTVASTNTIIVNGVNNSISQLGGIFCGTGNSVSGGSVSGVIWGGSANSINRVSSGVICAGNSNSLFTANNNFIGAGSNNAQLFANQSSCAIVAGSGNTLNNAGLSDTIIMGGVGNSITSGNNSMFMGGLNNKIAASNELAFGTNANGGGDVGTFIWSDTSTGIYSASAGNTFNARAAKGFYFSTNSTGTISLFVAAGGNAWNSLCDQQYKINAQPVDTIATLTTLATLPINSWSLVTQNPSIIHIGPYAGDFFNAFGYGEDPGYINNMDAIGVLFAAVQGLYQFSLTKSGITTCKARKQQNIKERQEYIIELEERIERLENLLRAYP